MMKNGLDYMQPLNNKVDRNFHETYTPPVFVRAVRVQNTGTRELKYKCMTR